MALPPPPDFRFNSGNAPSPEALASLQLQKNQQERQAQNDEIERVKNVTSMASQLVQSMVTAAHKRQLDQGLQTLATTSVPQPSITVPSPSSPEQMGVMPAGVSTGADYSNSASPADHTFAQPPVNVVDPRKLASLRLAQAMAPEKFGEAVTAQAFPPKATLEDIAAKEYQKTGKISSNTIDAIQAVRGAKSTPTTIDKKVNGVNETLIKHGDQLFHRDGTPVLPTEKVEPIPMGEMLNQTRLALGTQTDLRDMAKGVINTLKNSPAAKIALSSDNVLNQIKRANDGTVIMDKTTATLLAGEADRALAGTGSISAERAKDLMPTTLRSHAADLVSFATNNPTDRNVRAYLNNIAKEISGRRDQSYAAVRAEIAPQLSAARLAMKNDLVGFKNVVASMGLDPKAALSGRIKFLPGTESLLYGPGGGATGIGEQPAVVLPSLDSLLEQ